MNVEITRTHHLKIKTGYFTQQKLMRLWQDCGRSSISAANSRAQKRTWYLKSHARISMTIIASIIVQHHTFRTLLLHPLYIDSAVPVLSRAGQDAQTPWLTNYTSPDVLIFPLPSPLPWAFSPRCFFSWIPYSVLKLKPHLFSIRK